MGRWSWWEKNSLLPVQRGGGSRLHLSRAGKMFDAALARCCRISYQVSSRECTKGWESKAKHTQNVGLCFYFNLRIRLIYWHQNQCVAFCTRVRNVRAINATDTTAARTSTSRFHFNVKSICLKKNEYVSGSAALRRLGKVFKRFSSSLKTFPSVTVEMFLKCSVLRKKLNGCDLTSAWPHSGQSMI